MEDHCRAFVVFKRRASNWFLGRGGEVRLYSIGQMYQSQGHRRCDGQFRISQ
jgi:hypothetical protein